MATLLNIQQVKDAMTRVAPVVRRTPVMTSSSINKMCGAKIFFKCENFQKGGSFKIRGAVNSVSSLSDKDAAAGVVTHSYGNHGTALAIAAFLRGIPAHIVMPDDSIEVMRREVSDFGAKISYCRPSFEERDAAAKKVAAESGARLIHPSHDLMSIAGQGTVMLEFLEDVPDLDLVMVPVGGGGLISGISIVLKSLTPKTRVVGVEPKGADDLFQSLNQGTLIPCKDPQTVAASLRTEVGPLTFEIVKELVDEVVTVTDPAIVYAMRCVWERLKIIVEPSAVVALASILEKDIDVSGLNVGVILSGGNVNLDSVPWHILKEFKPRTAA